MLRRGKEDMPTLPRQPTPLDQSLPRMQAVLLPTYSEIVQVARKAFIRGTTRVPKFRVEQLKAMERMLDENEIRIAEALQEDINKPKFETIIMEIEATRNEIKMMLINIHQWAKPVSTEKNMMTLLDKTYIVPQPYGVVLILGAWNYPINLCMIPMLGAVGAGNCVIVKPSENTPATSKLLAELIPRYMDQDCYHVVLGGIPETTELLKERFDYIFYTGSPVGGQIVREAANKYLTPITLELGGKSPAYLDESMDFEIGCKRLAWGKFMNLGQTCVAPDYVLCTAETQERFINQMKKVLKEFYGEDPKSSPDLGRIVNDKQFQRITKLLKTSGTIAVGGNIVEEERFIEPTIIKDVSPSDPIMKEEIFGPILPIVTVNDQEEAVKFINSRERPLAFYIFSTNKFAINNMLRNTTSGGVCVNDAVVQLGVDSLPFGGIGMSGMGRYRGKFSFDTFSHQKAVLERNYNIVAEKLSEARYPPFTDAKIEYIRFMSRRRAFFIPPHTDYILMLLLGAAIALIVQKLVALFTM